jgi:nitroreductase
MSIFDVILSRRSIRQFRSDPIPGSILEQLVNAARLAPSASNLQPLEYVIVDQSQVCRRIFPCLKWAAYINPEGNPLPGQEPVAYIVVLVNTAIRKIRHEWDAGASIENMLLAAWDMGIGSCWIISADKPSIAKILSIPDSHEIDSVIAFGYPAETSVVEDLEDSVKYWKDEAGGFHVPKRKLKDIIHFNRF